MASKFTKVTRIVAGAAAAAGTAVAAGKALKPHIGTIASKVRRGKTANAGDRSVQNVSFRDDNKNNGDKA